MILLMLGLMDIIAGVVLGLISLGFGVGILGVAFGAYLMLKGTLFIVSGTSFVDLVDIVAGVVIILASYGVGSVFYWIFVVWLVQKGLFSVMAR